MDGLIWLVLFILVDLNICDLSDTLAPLRRRVAMVTWYVGTMHRPMIGAILSNLFSLGRKRHEATQRNHEASTRFMVVSYPKDTGMAGLASVWGLARRRPI